MENGRCLDYKGTKIVTYAELLSGSDRLPVCVHVSDEPVCRIEVRLVVLQNKQGIYPKAGTPDNIPGAFYRTQPKGWMDQTLFPVYFTEPRTITTLPDNKRRFLYVDICTAHNETQALKNALENITTELRRFPPNCTHLIKPLDQLILRAFKALFPKKWARFRSQINQHTDTGRLANPGKSYYLTIVRDCINELNERLSGNIGLARKAMIVCDLIPDVDGNWKVEQLSEELQAVVAKNLSYFHGQDPST